MTLHQIQQQLHHSLQQDPYRASIKRVSLFGSFLHGDARADSDIDLLLETNRTLSLFQLIELQERLSQQLGRPVDLVEKNSLDKYIKETVLAEARTLYEQGNPTMTLRDSGDLAPPQKQINRDRLHLLHIQDGIKKIEQYSQNLDYAHFARQEAVFDAILMQLIVIGEAAQSLSQDFREKHHSLPWQQIVGLRHKIAHGYFQVEPKIVWEIIHRDLPELRDRIEAIESIRPSSH